MSTIAPPASRNAACPCGSGRRYKECHGRVDPNAGVESRRELTGAMVARMQQALTAQRAGRFAEAIAAYDEVIRNAPGTFDAWHMRGVANLQSHRFDEAEADITQALALKPDLPMGRSNLELVHGGRYSALSEERLSRAALPRFAPLVVDPPVDPLDGAGPGMRCFVLDLGASPPTLARLVDRARVCGAGVHRVAFGADARLVPGDDATLRATGPSDLVVAVGCDPMLDDWTLAMRPFAVALIVDGERLTPVEDRLRELSGQRRRRVRLAATHDAALDLAPLPHLRLAP